MSHKKTNKQKNTLTCSHWGGSREGPLPYPKHTHYLPLPVRSAVPVAFYSLAFVTYGVYLADIISILLFQLRANDRGEDGWW